MSLGNPDVPGPWTSCMFKNKGENTCQKAEMCLRERVGERCINGGTLRSNLIEMAGDSTHYNLDFNKSQ